MGATSSNEKVFKSLNCAKCKKPFTTDSTRAPRSIWFQKRLYICYKCFDSEKAKKKEERWKSIDDDAFQNVHTVTYLLDLIDDDSLQLNESNCGYIIAKEPFVSPKCPVCSEPYNIALPMKCPYDLYCHHTICFGCYHRKRTDYKNKSSKYVFEIVCPICQKITITTVDETEENALKDFLRELPGMIQQQHKVTKAPCSTCPNEDQIQDMHYCDNCKVEICIHCKFNEHRIHTVIKLAEERAKAIAKETDQVTANQVDTCKAVLNHLQSELHKKISELQSKFQESARAITEIEKHDEAIQKRNECRQLGERFEEVSKKLAPCLRACNTELETLLKEFGE